MEFTYTIYSTLDFNSSNVDSNGHDAEDDFNIFSILTTVYESAPFEPPPPFHTINNKVNQ